MTERDPLVHLGGHGMWRAELPTNGRSSPWMRSEAAAKCWQLVREDRLRPLVEAGYVITGVTRRKGWLGSTCRS